MWDWRVSRPEQVKPNVTFEKFGDTGVDHVERRVAFSIFQSHVDAHGHKHEGALVMPRKKWVHIVEDGLARDLDSIHREFRNDRPALPEEHDAVRC